MMRAPAFHVYLYGPGGKPLGSDFEEVCLRLTEIPRLYLEPDGSLLWTGDGWQVGGILYDRGGVLQYTELQGSCPLPQWQSLVVRIGSPHSTAIGSATDSHPANSPQPSSPLTESDASRLAPLSVLRLSDQTLHDLQTFERITWPIPPASSAIGR